VESLGDKLKSAREAKGYSHEQVGKETNIAYRYLQALESEDFAKFPGEPYLLGFLRSYGEYLGLDVNELLSNYRAIKIQDQPVPVEQLLRSPRSFSKPLSITLTVVGILLVLGLIGYFAFGRGSSIPAQNAILQLPMEYILEGTFVERRFYKGDTILVPIGEDQYRVELLSMDDPPVLSAAGRNVTLNLSGDTDVDLNGDGIAELQVTLSDYDKRSSASGALIRFALKISQDFDSEQGGSLTEEQATQTGTVIFTSANTYPFTLEIQFQTFCMFRWEVDRRERTERYFSRGDKLSIPVQNTIRLWSSNATAVNVELNGAGRTVTLNLGIAGEVVVIDLRWLRDNDGRFRLTQYRLE
jgi:cytoskeletal protein RodZ